MTAPPLPEDGWGDLLLDGLPDVGLLDDLQLDCVLGDADLPPGLDPLEGLDYLGLDPSDAAIIGDTSAAAAAAAASAGSYPASSDLLESLQLDAAAFAVQPASSSGARHSPSGSGSGSDSPVVLPLVSASGAAAVQAPPCVSPAAAVATAQQLSPSPSPLRSRSSPATSESENNQERQQRGISPSGSSRATATTAGGQHLASAGSPAPAEAALQQQELLQHPHQHHAPQQPVSRQHMSEEEKRLARMQRNRENAQLSRQRKKLQMAELESRCAVLTQQNAQLTSAVQRLTAENATLRQQLALVCQQAGRNAAAAVAGKPAAPGAAAAAGKPAAAAAAAAKPAAAGAAAPAIKLAASAGTAAPPAPAPAANAAAKSAAPAAAAQAPAARAAGAAPAAAAKPAAQPATPAAAAAAAARAGRPTAGAAVASAARPAAGNAATAAAAAAVAARGLLPHWPLLPFGFLPKVALPIQQQQQARLGAQQQAAMPRPASAAPKRAAPTPAPAPATAPAAAGAAAGARAPKRARTAAAGASTAFLALFTLFMFAGPFTPAPPLTTTHGSGISAGAGSQRTLQALPDTAAAASVGGSSNSLVGSDGGGLHRAGRGLQALPAASSSDDGGGGGVLGPLPRRQYGPSQQPHPLGPLGSGGIHLEEGSHAVGAAAHAVPAGGGSHLQQLLNSTLQALLLEPGNAQLEAAALQRLQELGPVALLLDADAPGATPGSNPLAASVAYPRLAEQLFGGAGLEVPQMCHKVLEFDAASVPHAVRSRRSLERFVLGSTGFRGRSLAAASSSPSNADPALPAGGEARADVAEAAPRAEKPTLRIEELGSEQEEGGADSGGRTAGSSALQTVGAAAGGPVLVSILLPANASGGSNSSRGGSGGHKLSAIDKVFVVLLHPADRYVTYSCALPRAVVL